MSTDGQFEAPPPPDQWVKSDTWTDDFLAIDEEKLFPKEELIKDAHGKNKLRVIRQSGWIMVVIMWVVSILFLVSFVLWTWHQLAPSDWMWMTQSQLDQIQTIIFSGAIGGLITTGAQKYILKTEE